MARPFKIFLGILAAFVGLIVIALLAVSMLFDPNDYREEIAAAVKKETGRDLTLGDIELSVFPWLKVKLANVSLSNAPGFGTEPFVQIGEAGVGVKLMPLLFDKQLQVSTVTLDGLKLNLAKDENGKSNWEDLTQPKAEEPEKPKVEGETSFDLQSFDIGGISIKNSAVSYSDAQSKAAYLLTGLELETGSISPGDPFDVDAALTVTAEAQKLSADIELAAHVVPDLSAQKIGIEDLKLGVKTTGVGLQADLKLAGEVAADLKAQLYRISGLKLDVDASGTSIPGGKQQASLVGDLDYDQAKGAFKLSKAQLKAAGLDITTEITGENLDGETPKLHGPITLAKFSPRELLAKLGQPPMNTADATALSAASLSAQYSGSFTAAKFDALQLTLDQTNVSGTLAVRDFATQALEFALKLDQIDADRYLAPASDEPTEKAEEKNSDINAIELSTELLEKLNASGTLDIATLKLKKMTLKDVRLKLSGPQGSAKLADLSAQLYGGKIATSTRISPGKRPGYAIKSQIQSITLGPILQDFTGKDSVTGLGSINLDITSAGNTVGEARKALNGDLSLDFHNGAVKGFNLGQIIRQGRAMIKGEKLADNEPQQTDFAVITFAAKIVNGILQSDQLDARNPLLRVGGEGQIDLVNETINYLVKPTVVDTGKGQGGKGLEDLNGLTIPIKLSGSLFAPKYKVDIENALKQKATEKIREELKGNEGELKEKLNKELGRGLDRLFGNKKKKEEETPAAPQEPAPSP